MQKAIIIILLIALLLPSVSAEFLAFGDLEIKTGPCQSEIRNLTIQNTGQQATYSITVDGEGSDYITFSAINFALEAGQKALINSHYTIPCNAKPGTYPLSIYFSDGEIEQQLDQQITIELSDNINITATNTSAVITPCDTAAYSINLHNPLNFTEIYTITATGHPNVHVSEKQAVLKGGERKNIIISATPDDCTQSGSFPLKTEFTTEKSHQQKEQLLELIIKSTDIPILAESIDKIRTDYTDSTAELTIENTGDRTTQYILTVEGADWATISPKQVSLSPGQTKTLALRLTPKTETPKGNYPLILTATVEETGIKYGKELLVKLQPPTFIEKNPAIVIAIAIIILAIIAGAYFVIKYFKSQAFKEAYRKWKEKREAKRKAKEQKKAELLKKQQEQQKKEHERKQAEKEHLKKQLQKQIEQDYKKEYHVIAKKQLVTGKTKTNWNKIFAVIIGIAIILLIMSFWSVISPNITYVALGFIILAAIYLAHKISRLTIIKAKWKLLLEKQETSITCWKKGLSLLNITAKKPIKNLKLIIKRTKARIAPSPAVYRTFTIKTNTPEEALALKATITVSKKWIAFKKVNIDDIKLARYNNQNWTTIPLKKTGENKQYVHFTADIKTGAYSIYTKPPKQPTNHTKKLIWGLIAIAIIAGIAVILTPNPAPIAHGIQPQTWQQDTVHRIDLSKYFSDPDDDKLTFTTTETKNVLIEISGNTAYITPKTGWNGEEKVRFIANDGKGGQASSNTVSLRVRRQIIPTWIQPYIALILAILTAIFLIWTAVSQRSQKKK